jgi:uncharacterized phage protein (TIGR01671 family)
MRELKFRFFDHKIKNEMIYQQSYEAKNVIFDKWETTPKCSSLMQYTGLRDKNNREIYEGDIVTNKTKDFSGNGFRGKNLKMLVEWDQKECFYSLSVYDEEYWGFKKLTKSSAADVEVIGNTYENPDMIPNN